MKKVLFSLLAMLVIGAGTVEASFPVKKSNKEQSVEATVDADLALVQNEAVAETSDAGGFDSEDWILLALWFFLGDLLPIVGMPKSQLAGISCSSLHSVDLEFGRSSI